MKKLFFVLLLVTVACALSFSQQSAGQNVSAPQKFALVIGNGNYTGISRLNNPVNDANDMETALKGLGFTVEKVLNGNLDQMENAASNLVRRLGASRNVYGFFFYAGHGVQSGGDNYLIPVDAGNIQTENHLRQRAFSVQTLLDNLNDSGNELNMIVLDACRDNPFGWSRSGSRGLSVVGRVPAGSIIMYATSANSTAADGTGRNGLFTSQLLNNIKNQSLSIRDVFDKTGEDVLSVSGGKQHPELSLRFFGASSAYLGSRPAPAVVTQSAPVPAPAPAPTPSPATQSAPTVQPTPAPTVSTGQTYKIGDKGPAGGIIFYDKGNNSNGWRYMEVSPVVNLGNVQFGLHGVGVSGTKTRIGEGKRNTELIIAELNKKGETGRAAQLCRAYTLNGYNDWFLPSKDELNEMYKARIHLGISSGRHWSSSQGISNFDAWNQDFVTGNQYYNSKSSEGGVRAIRAF